MRRFFLAPKINVKLMDKKIFQEKKLKEMFKEQMLGLKAREIEVSRRTIYRPLVKLSKN